MIGRRQFILNSALGLGTLALNAETQPWTIPAKAKRIIWLYMVGGPSQVDLFDHKPLLNEMYNREIPESVIKGQRLTTMTSRQEILPCAPSKFEFRQHGKSGAWVSELLPWTAKMVDDLSFIKTVHTDEINHDPAITYMQTGSNIPGRPSLGAWLSFGLGRSSKNLPDYVCLTPSWTSKLDPQALFQRLWGSGFLPSQHQGTLLRSKDSPVLYLKNPNGLDTNGRKLMLSNLNELNRYHSSITQDPEINTRISQYELAFKMQSSVPELMNFSNEKKSTLELYGDGVQKPGTFAASCLLARRMIERDVRMVQIFHRGWDQHANIDRNLPLQCKDVDQACYGLIQDLKSRRLLDDTLVVWGGEFGRTPYCQGNLTKTNYGRDHHPKCNTMWLAGGGIKPGITYGKTDEFGFNVAENPVHINDLNATILNQLGINHEQLTRKFKGLNVRLTGVEKAVPIQALL